MYEGVSVSFGSHIWAIYRDKSTDLQLVLNEFEPKKNHF